MGSLICYLIGLSHIDPIENGLFLGRFLNEEMASVPDIDLDFPRDIREKLILRVYEHFGHEHVGLVATFPTYRIRSAVREVGKALGLPPAELDRLAKLSEGGCCRGGPRRTFARRWPACPTTATSWTPPPLAAHFADLAEQIAGFPRHISQHVGGMVISSKPLVELVPLEQAAMEGRVLIQWDKDSVDDARMIKIDFLALGMLSAVDECLELIEEQRGKRVDLSRIDFRDERVYDAICTGRHHGRLPDRVAGPDADPAARAAAVAGGPDGGGGHHPAGAHRGRRRQPLHPPPHGEGARDLRPPLAGAGAGGDAGGHPLPGAGAPGGDGPGGLHRRPGREPAAGDEPQALAGGHRKLQEQFIEGCLGNGVSSEVAETVFRKIAGFAEFGFPKAHAAAFGLLAYQTAWLRTYYPAEFLCALFNAQPMGFYGPHVLVNDGKRHGVEVLPPDINRSGANCTVESMESSSPLAT